mmetsp:Transcript_31944/g.48509  ORF Transcript_31944/g.48509 Transcript_31944/m.48509 type:complete len:252 (-) Transcript_31944:320-1075(-)
MILLHQCVLNLMGRSDNPVILRGTAMDEDGILEQVAPENAANILNEMYVYRMLLAYTFGEYKAVVDIADKSRLTVAKVLPGQPHLVIHAFYDALAACALVRESSASSRKHKEIIKASMKRMKSWAASSPSNCKHRVLLLKAEYDALRGKKSSACKAYDASIGAAHESGIVQEEALAHERAALFFIKLGDEAKASHYLATAHQLYLDWGADAKSSQLQTQYSTMISKGRTRRSFQDYMIKRSASVASELKSD